MTDQEIVRKAGRADRRWGGKECAHGRNVSGLEITTVEARRVIYYVTPQLFSARSHRVLETYRTSGHTHG